MRAGEVTVGLRVRIDGWYRPGTGVVVKTSRSTGLVSVLLDDMPYVTTWMCIASELEPCK